MPEVTVQLRNASLLRAHLEMSGLTYRQVAGLAGIKNHATIASLVGGRRKGVTISNAHAISGVLNVNIHTLFHVTDQAA